MWDDVTEFEELHRREIESAQKEQYIRQKTIKLRHHMLSRRASLDPDLYQALLKQNLLEKPPEDSNLLIKKFYEWKYLYFQPITAGSVRGAIFCLLTINIGSTMLALPRTILSVGLIPGYLGLIIGGIMGKKTLDILTEHAYEHNIYDYSLLVDKLLGERWFTATQYFSVVNNFGSILTFNMFSNILNVII